MSAARPYRLPVEPPQGEKAADEKGSYLTQIGSYLFALGKEETKLGSYLIRLGKRGNKKGSYLFALGKHRDKKGSYLFSSRKEETKKGSPKKSFLSVSDEWGKTGNQNPGLLPFVSGLLL